MADEQTLRGHLPDETERTYDAFAQCTDCARTYWRGAHHARLDAIVTHAERNFGTRTRPADAETFLAQLD